MLLLFDENKTHCCRVRVCPPWVECDPGPPKDTCDLPSELVTEASGNASYTRVDHEQLADAPEDLRVDLDADGPVPRHESDRA
jgi:hypothetical protein